VPLASHKVL